MEQKQQFINNKLTPQKQNNNNQMMEELEKDLESIQIISQVKQQEENISITGVIYDPETLLHEEYKKKKSDPDHFENPDRVNRILDHLQQNNLLQNIQNQLEIVESMKPLNNEIIKIVYTQEFIDNVQNKWQEQYEEDDSIKNVYFDADTYGNKYTFKAAKLSAASNVYAVDKIMNDEWQNSFCIVRPPGHHSGHCERPSGFCFFNNVVIGAKYSLQNYPEKVKKVLILDWDVHYGDGTAALVEENPNILFISIHQYDKGTFYPYTGDIDYIGVNKGEYSNINIPFDNDFTNEIYPGNNEYMYIFERFISPIIKDFKPDLTFISSGFDSCQNDLLGDSELDIDGYAYMISKLNLITNGKIIVNLEGGYNLDEIPKAAEGVLRGLLQEQLPVINSENNLSYDEFIEQCNPNKIGLEVVEKCLKKFSNFYPILQQDQEALLFEQNIKNKQKSLSLRNQLIDCQNRLIECIEQNKNKMDNQEIQDHQNMVNIIKQYIHHGIEIQEFEKIGNSINITNDTISVINQKYQN